MSSGLSMFTDTINITNIKCHVIKSRILFTNIERNLQLKLHSSYAFFIRAYTHVKVEFA
jgi:hypothetical protein